MLSDRWCVYGARASHHINQMTKINQTRPVPPIASIEDWYEVTNSLAALTPQILMLERG